MIRQSPRTRLFRPAMIVCLLAAALLPGCGGGDSAEQDNTLYCYVGGTMRPAMEELVRLYQAETGTRVELDYGDSGSIVIKAETTRKGDLCVVHDPFHGFMTVKGLSVEGWAVATLEPVIAVAKGNPKKIEGIKDLARPGIRLVLTDANYSTMGHVCRVIFQKAGLAEAIEKNTLTRTRAGGEAANAVVLGHADATIVWNAVVFLRREKLDAVPVEPPLRPVPKVDAVTSATYGPVDMSRIQVTMDLLEFSKRPEAARAFAAFAASPRGQEVWKQFGFGPPPEVVHLVAPAPQTPPTAEAQPSGNSIYIYAGAGLRPALEDIAHTFTAKTGVAVETNYGGSGMLISNLRLTKRGDLFMPGDEWYIDLADKEGLVEPKAPVCWFVPVILVQKGNPKSIRGLADLARPGLRIGLGNPKACQVGRASEEIIAKNRLDAAAIEKNLAFSSVTVNELGLQIKTGQLDAAIVWDAVAAQYADSADVVAIPPAQNAVSRVAVAVLKSARNLAGAEAFVQFLRGPEGQALFRKHQYRTEPPQ